MAVSHAPTARPERIGHDLYLSLTPLPDDPEHVQAAIDAPTVHAAFSAAIVEIQRRSWTVERIETLLVADRWPRLILDVRLPADWRMRP